MGQPLRPERPAGRLYIDARDVVVCAPLPAVDGLAYRCSHPAAARSRLLDMVWRPGSGLRGLLVARHAGRSDASLDLLDGRAVTLSLPARPRARAGRRPPAPGDGRGGVVP